MGELQQHPAPLQLGMVAVVLVGVVWKQPVRVVSMKTAKPHPAMDLPETAYPALSVAAHIF